MSDATITGWAFEVDQDRMTRRGEDALFDVTKRAMDRASVTRSEIDAVIPSGHDAYDGITICMGKRVCPAGGYNKTSNRVQNGGLFAIHQAVRKIQAGKAKRVVVPAMDIVDTDEHAVSNISQEPFVTRPIGIRYLQTLAFVSQYYLDERDVTEEDFARVAAKNYTAGSHTPWPGHREPHEIDDVLDSELVCSPLRALECCPVSLGAAAVVIAAEERARTSNGIPIEGIGLGSSPYRYRSIADRLHQPSLGAARETAYREANIDSPVDAIDMAEIYNPAAPLELLGYETLGLCKPGEAPILVRNGITDFDGALPVNASGGALTTNLLNAGGILRTAQAARFLNGEVDLDYGNPRRAVVTDSDAMLGDPGRTDAVAVLGGG